MICLGHSLFAHARQHYLGIGFGDLTAFDRVLQECLRRLQGQDAQAEPGQQCLAAKNVQIGRLHDSFIAYVNQQFIQLRFKLFHVLLLRFLVHRDSVFSHLNNFRIAKKCAAAVDASRLTNDL